MESQITRHIASDNPRVMIVDGSKVVRKMVEQVLKAKLPNAEILSCATGAEAQQVLQEGIVDLLSMALELPDMDGLELARYVREHSPQTYIPIIVVSGSVQERLVEHGLSEDITDYFDKSLGFAALAEFIRGYVEPVQKTEGRLLYIEDSKVVALATRRMLEKYGFSITHTTSVEDALQIIDKAKQAGGIAADVVLTDVYLKGGLTGKELVIQLRGEIGYSKAVLPIVVMTADDNPINQRALLAAGANDLVSKPVEERLLVNKLLFQMRVCLNRRTALQNT